jgi:hypothetical protein
MLNLRQCRFKDVSKEGKVKEKKKREGEGKTGRVD